jgi:hypothetical protein
VAGDLRQKSAAGPHHYDIDYPKFLQGGVRQVDHALFGFVGAIGFVQCHKIVQIFDFVAALGQSGRADHHFFGGRNRLRVEYGNFNLLHRMPP